MNTRTAASAPFFKLAHTMDGVDSEGVAVDVIEHDHVERRRRRALLFVATDVQVVVVVPPVGQPMNQPRVAVIGEDHRLVGGEERVELVVAAGRADARSAAAASSGPPR